MCPCQKCWVTFGVQGHVGVRGVGGLAAEAVEQGNLGKQTVQQIERRPAIDAKSSPFPLPALFLLQTPQTALNTSLKPSPSISISACKKEIGVLVFGNLRVPSV